jgi:hypothetical protein
VQRGFKTQTVVRSREDGVYEIRKQLERDVEEVCIR